MTPTSHTPFLRRWRRRLAQEHGQALVEFAIVLPVLLMIIVGILAFGRYTNYANQQTQMAGQAARYAALDVNPSSTLTLQNYVQAQATGELAAGSSSVTSAVKVYLYTYPSSTSPAAGTPVVACVISTVSLLPMLGTVTSMTIVQSATMRIEQAQTSAKWTPDTTIPSKCPAT
ncbi:MAG TPA: TadE/TadG family type IV pilus assembly protein [Solirubrobacteraceae bacterium]|jgi:Flp pilus assembly protein TadG|nr:TadE/TadG family type IV pilus assembly protein [Solirubrobacteraceae bacterium]